MNKSTILLLSSPTVLGSMLLMLLSDKPAEARETEQNSILLKTQAASPAKLNCDRINCTGNNHLASFERTFTFTAPEQQLEPEAYPNLERTPEGHLILEFTEEESAAAMKLFGCDCIKSINALRQTRGISIGVEGDRILPGAPIKTCSENRLKSK
ncbi:MAG: hypothetical protein HC939_18935 [Pleurocapsa sp. SU_5_0]|nr:hypothetical protein [Pleurocapsa sp. SU_5_0]